MKLLSGVFPAGRRARFASTDAPTGRRARAKRARRESRWSIRSSRSLPTSTVAENLFLGMESSRFGVLRRSEMRERAREALSSLEHGDISPDARVGVAFDRGAADRGDRAGASPRRPGAHPRRADQQPRARGRREDSSASSVGSRLEASRSSTSPIFSRRSSRSPTPTPCFATVGRWAREPSKEPRSRKSSASWSAGRFRRCSRDRGARRGEVVLEVEGLRGARAPRSATLRAPSR